MASPPAAGTPTVAVIMGSRSDWETMKAAAEMLKQFGVPHECRVVSAHRTPVWMAEFARGAEARGIQVIIAGAGGAAHLPGMVAAHTVLPVLGVPVQSAALQGLDSLLSIVQMPGGVPVATLAIGKAGRDQRRPAGRGHPRRLAARAARAAARVPRRADAGRSGRNSCREPRVDRCPGADARRAGQRPARPHVRDRRAAHGLPRPHVLAGRRHADRPGGRRRGHRRLRRPRRAARASRAASTSSPSSSRTCRSARPTRPPRSAPVRPCRRGAAHHAAARAREGVPRRSRASRQRRSRRATSLDELARGARRASALPGDPQDGGVRLRRQGPARGSTAPTTPSASGTALGRQEAVVESVRRLQARDLGGRGARRSTATFAHYGVVENRHRDHILDVYGRAGARCRRRWRARGRRRSRARCSRRSTTSACCASSSSSPRDGELLVNELAPRPHNSGHLTFDAARHQPVRAAGARGLRPAARRRPTLLRPAAMANLLGDLWADGEPRWAAPWRVPA